MNQHFYVRQSTGFTEMSEAQREAAIGLLRASLSVKGLQLTRNIMRLNHTLGERPPRHHQLLRARRSGGDDADLALSPSAQRRVLSLEMLCRFAA